MAKRLDRVAGFFDRSPVVSFGSIERIVPPGYAKQLVSYLIRKHRVHKLAKGCYTKHEDPALAVFCFQPAYLGLQSALSFHGLWEQETVPVIVTSGKARVGIRQVIGSNILVRRIAPEHFFGFETVEDGAFYLPYSDIEKTLIDLASFNKRLPADLREGFRKAVDPAKLRRYLARYPVRTRRMVLDYLSSSTRHKA